MIFLLISFVFFSFREADPRKKGKKPLVLTDRAKGIYGLSLLGTGLLALVIVIHGPAQPLDWLFAVQILPLLLVVTVTALTPSQRRINMRYREEAVTKLATINPYVIGITGSFGKTSVKHILGYILKMHAPTLITPGSVNTEMGIVRIIREQLTEQHKFFVVEMGAYGIGSIARLCRLTPPKLGIITAIGHAHYERFKDLEDTARAKFELVDAVMENGGRSVIHTDVLQRQYAKEIIVQHPSAAILCGDQGECQIQSVEQTPQGLSLSLVVGEETFQINTPLFGTHHAGNIALAFMAAKEVGMAPEDIVTALRSTPQIAHRLEVKQMGQSVLIDDAYNSNPQGFAAALRLLAALKKDGGRTILVTPGMVELGAAHDEEHTKIGELAAQTVDVAIAVLPERIKTFTAAYRANKKPEQVLIELPKFAAAQAWLAENTKPNDVVLLENDLPDIYERKIHF